MGEQSEDQTGKDFSRFEMRTVMTISRTMGGNKDEKKHNSWK